MKGRTMTTIVIIAVAAFAAGYVAKGVLAAGERVDQCRDCDIAARAVEVMMADDDAVGRLCEELADTPEMSPVTIDIDAIAQIESGGNARAVGAYGERGVCQIQEATWNEWVERMGESWSFDEAFDPDKNLAVANYGMNTRIPQMLDAYQISDTVAHRLICYNWGIGNLVHADRHECDWPESVERYVRRYRRACVERQRRKVACD